MADGTKMHALARRSANNLGISVEEYLLRHDQGLKWCVYCRAWHPVAEFGKDKHAWDGLNAACRKSQRQKNRKPPETHKVGGWPKGRKMSAATRSKMRRVHSGRNNANWKGGITPITRRARQHALYQQWRRAVIKRDGGFCRDCGSKPEQPHAHHIKSFKGFPDLRLDVDNGLTLCEPCHINTHAGERNGR